MQFKGGCMCHTLHQVQTVEKEKPKSHPEGTFSVCTFRNLYLASALLAVNVGDDKMMGLGYACLFEVGHECR